MGLINKLDLDSDVTFGALYRFADLARSAGIPDSQKIAVETTDAIGNPVDVHTLVADLGIVDELSRPVLIDRTAAGFYIDALTNALTQSDDKYDHETLGHLLDDLMEKDKQEE